MAKARTRRGPKGAGWTHHVVGRPLQARLIALEKHVGVFSEEQRFQADSRFNHPVILPAEAAMPDSMAKVFAEELAGLRRLGRDTKTCHHTTVGGYEVYGLTYFHYDGFKALLCVEHKSAFIAAWKEDEVLQPDSPRELIAGVDDGKLEAFLAQI
ncbi:MAG: hypothetical protein GWO16_11545 [Gammaproteobacteria bacterium]|nr:hypothetical protein [Gammaproteobacteria bacterium]NIR98568.1 hypothetical protein [Gammaproteobacteria bacterium]NIT64286.1 hypothetical protein [Gammaproteobacteria bacterium]NIV21216.1 hypothetical protein [Gammaproteobacteria bacterium]NIY32866.1 hypothetical protein [Gammaproteobacteria bacterium]